MSFWKRMFGASPKSPAPAPVAPPSAPQEVVITREWTEFLDNSPLREELQSLLVGTIRTWPPELQPSALAPHSWPAAMARIKAFIDGPYPEKHLRQMPGPPGPQYRIDRGIHRVSNVDIDKVLCEILPKLGPRQPAPEEVWQFIQMLASWPISKLVFTLPRVYEASQAGSGGKNVILVPEDLQIQIFRGAENMLFRIYGDLPTGAVFVHFELYKEAVASLLTGDA